MGRKRETPGRTPVTLEVGEEIGDELAISNDGDVGRRRKGGRKEDEEEFITKSRRWGSKKADEGQQKTKRIIGREQAGPDLRLRNVAKGSKGLHLKKYLEDAEEVKLYWQIGYSKGALLRLSK
ncbi:hypothetical protein TRV_04806 [Trichophyton verrucosum HKI 0517]|uniref:Uncharacterized protein n=1 Tax=Trichophyton verrucosum (strain HKI 0517) TaxID=663202 RepID=D4DCF3_TRIVH|nr:uncharacterized protein TRV_04806 [Trichophyton verrucosum HKI 0517]EFE40475.1 hypothetical protein TRV_04806 [Trichophyton verrucosum HKI 0517]